MRRYILLFLLALMCHSGWSANKPSKVFMFGFAASFNDSTVCFTDIQEVDSAYIDTKTKFLYSRENYSYQLRDYLQGQNFPSPTCVTVFALKKKDLEKKYQQMRKKYTGDGKFIIKDVKSPDFVYQAIKFEEQ